MGNVGPLEVVVVVIIALVIFGPKRVPELGKSLGKGIREFQAGLAGHGGEEEQAHEAQASQPAGTSEPPEAGTASDADDPLVEDRS
ncbi:MAG: twin-arginine translocase TatA/TatE family subunit [Solirubrobacterales bacterium]